jgi:hypothetical protein
MVVLSNGILLKYPKAAFSSDPGTGLLVIGGGDPRAAAYFDEQLRGLMSDFVNRVPELSKYKSRYEEPLDKEKTIKDKFNAEVQSGIDAGLSEKDAVAKAKETLGIQ